MSSNKKNARLSAPSARNLASLADKQGPLKREEVICPICWSVLMEPVSLPCNHNLCLDCFKKHVEETSLQCPCCRMRLSVWSRRAFRENNLVDYKLWERIQKEFPKLVLARRCGEDSQDLLPEDLVSVHDRKLVEIRQIGDEDVASPNKPIRRDGEMCTKNGEIRLELESMLQQHNEDIENQRRLEEIASTDLIRQLQDEETPNIDTSVVNADYQVARKMEETEKNSRLAEISARRKLFTEPDSSRKSTSTVSGLQLISQWTKPISPSTASPAVKIGGIITPTSSGKRPSLSSLSSRLTKKTKKSSRSSVPNSVTKSKPRKNEVLSQNSIIAYLASSQVQSSLEESMDSQEWCITLSPQPSTSAAARRKAVHLDGELSVGESSLESHSAFSPMKSNTSATLNVVSGNLKYQTVPNIIKHFRELSQEYHSNIIKESNSPERLSRSDTKTPDSITLEVNSHFRPIRSAPRTPPKQLKDGSFITPEIIKTTPIRPCNILINDSASVVKDCALSSPLCISDQMRSTDRKRISKDSGHASRSSSTSFVDIQVVDGDGFSSRVIQNPYTESKLLSDERESPNSPVIPTLTPNVLPITGVVPKELANPRATPPTLEISSMEADMTASSINSVRTCQSSEQSSDSWFNDVYLSSSQDSQGMDLDILTFQEAEFERLRLKMLQEAEDFRLALNVQKNWNEANISPSKQTRYGLRSWLKNEST